ncbi:MAG: EAL domain-containing protein [Bryobacterales bacterium]|nr:EAL domain-containing protein [Bryobacterales bacterium]
MDRPGNQPAVVYVSAPEASLRFTYLSDNVESLLGYPARHFLEDPQFWVELVHPEDRTEAVQRRQSGLGMSLGSQLDYRMRHADGRFRWIRDSLKPATSGGQSGTEIRSIGFWTDISDQHEATGAGSHLGREAQAWMWSGSEESLRAMEQLGHSLPALFYIYDLAEHRHLFVNRSYEESLGYPIAHIQGRGPEFLPAVMHPDDLRRALALFGRFDALAPGETLELEYRMKRATGEYRWMRSRSLVVGRDAQGHARQVLGVAEDVTDRKRLEEQLVHTALFDALTDLPNRALFLDRLERAIRRGKRQPNYRFAVLYMDLDRFKLINDGLGHLAGDQMLVFIARRLESCLREGDTFARLGGDEFALLMEGLAKDADALLLADRIQNELRKPFLLGINEVVTSTSIGITFSNPLYENPKEVLRDADIALYRAKEQGLGCYQIFDAEMHERMKTQIRLEEELRRGLERNEFELYYQPIRSLNTGKLLGLEALVRWQHPTRGLLGPDDFLAAAEETGLIVQLGWWVLGEACRTAAGWVRDNVLPLAAYVSVNLASKQFGQLDVVDRIAAALHASKLPASRLRLEILEQVILESPAVVADKICRIRALGAGLLLDDFGTGYSSLSRLVNYQIDGMKIDRSFVAAMNESASHRRLVQALIHLAHDLNIAVIAEGVQTAEQATLLREMKCDAVQGIMFLPPTPASGLTGVLTTDA